MRLMPDPGSADDLVTSLEARAREAGISINALCRKAGVARSTFSRWKAGRTEPQLRIYRRLIDAIPTNTAA